MFTPLRIGIDPNGWFYTGSCTYNRVAEPTVKGHLLVVDDEPAACELLSRWLRADGYDVCEAHDANAALTAMTARSADVAFCDVHMPGLSGIWLTRELRRRFPTTAIVLATGSSALPAKITMQHGVLAYLLKPFRRSSVLAAAERAISWHRIAVARGTPAADDADRVETWLGSIDEALKRDLSRD